MTYIGDTESFENVMSIKNMASRAEKDEHITKLNKTVGLISPTKRNQPDKTAKLKKYSAIQKKKKKKKGTVIPRVQC